MAKVKDTKREGVKKVTCIGCSSRSRYNKKGQTKKKYRGQGRR